MKKIRNFTKKLGAAVVVSGLASAPAFATTGGVDVTEAVAVVGGFVAAALLLGIAYIKLSATRKGLSKLGG